MWVEPGRNEEIGKVGVRSAQRALCLRSVYIEEARWRQDTRTAMPHAVTRHQALKQRRVRRPTFGARFLQR